MTSGLQVFNDDGVIQIDENYRNLTLKQSYAFTTSGDHSFTLNGCTNPAAVLYSTDTNGICIFSVSQAGTSWTWRVNGIGEVHIFDVPPAASAHGSGLQVFDASGNLAFDSSYDQLRVRDAIGTRPHFDRLDYPLQTVSTVRDSYGLGATDYNTILPGFNDGTGEGAPLTPYAKTAGEKWGWIVAGNPRAWYQPGGTGDIYKSTSAFLASGDNFKVRQRDMGVVQSGEYWPGITNGSNQWLTFIDLTGITA